MIVSKDSSNCIGHGLLKPNTKLQKKYSNDLCSKLSQLTVNIALRSGTHNFTLSYTGYSLTPKEEKHV